LFTALGVAVGLSAPHPPAVVRGPSEEFLLAFRRAPNRKAFGEENNNHADLNRQLCQLCSRAPKRA